jgi:hypothetical protein
MYRQQHTRRSNSLRESPGFAEASCRRGMKYVTIIIIIYGLSTMGYLDLGSGS